MKKPSNKKVILAISDVGTTGIAESLRGPLLHWHEKGHEIWHLGLGFSGWPSSKTQRKMYPWYQRLIPVHTTGQLTDKFGQKQIGRAVATSKCDFVITSFDAWMISYLSNPEVRDDLDKATKDIIGHTKREFQHIAYFPMDSAVQGMYLPAGMDEMIAGFDIPVTYSRFAQQILMRDTGLAVPFIPISHDPKIFHPGDRMKARKSLDFENIKDKFVVAMVGTNQYRKHYGEFFDVVAPFAKAHPDDVLIMPVTTWDTKIAGGTEIKDCIWRHDLMKQTIDPSQFVGALTEEGMANLYRSIDVLLLCTAGEGAGLPPLRARACGIPALVSNNTSNSEFCADDFERVPCTGKYLDPFGSNLERYTTDIGEMRRRLEILYENKVFRNELGQKGIQEMKAYEFDRVNPSWDALLENH